MSYMWCPRCGFTVRLRVDFVFLETCPRCIARARVSVPMQLSNGPSRDRDAEQPKKAIPASGSPGSRSTALPKSRPTAS
jgi:hypothetical protein